MRNLDHQDGWDNASEKFPNLNARSEAGGNFENDPDYLTYDLESEEGEAEEDDEEEAVDEWEKHARFEEENEMEDELEEEVDELEEDTGFEKGDEIPWEDEPISAITPVAKENVPLRKDPFRKNVSTGINTGHSAAETLQTIQRVSRVASGENAKTASGGKPEVVSEKPSPSDGATTPRRHPAVTRNLTQFLSGNILSKAELITRLPYIVFVSLLMMLYIANGFHMHKLYSRYDKLSREVKELRAKAMTISALRMSSTRQSEVLHELEERGIQVQESLTPPQVIR